jgi:uncharacterized repeat protein (TIGR02543 family)
MYGYDAYRCFGAECCNGRFFQRGGADLSLIAAEGLDPASSAGTSVDVAGTDTESPVVPEEKDVIPADSTVIPAEVGISTVSQTPEALSWTPSPFVNSAIISASQKIRTASVDEDAIYTVTFKSNGSTYKTYYVENGESVHEPPTPELPSGMTSFLGWYAEGADTSDPNEAFDFTNKITALTVTDNNLTLTAVFSDKFLVQFEHPDGFILHSEVVAPGTTLADPGVSFIPPSGKTFNSPYWDFKGTETTFIFNTTKVTGNITLTPELYTRYTAYFHTSGSYVEPQEISSDGLIAKPANPTRTGYTFAGVGYWSTKAPKSNQNPDGATIASKATDEFNFAAPVAANSDVHLYAIWKAEKAGYTIIYWNERANIADDPGADITNYEFAAQKVIPKASSTLDAGTLLNNSTIETLAGGANLTAAKTTYPNLQYSHYGFSNAVGRTVVGNDSTIINVYFKRNVYTLTFDMQGDADSVGSIYKDFGSLKMQSAYYVRDGYSYQTITGPNSTSEKYSFTAKFEQYLDDLWPLNPDITGMTTGIYPYGWFATGQSSNNFPHTNFKYLNLQLTNFCEGNAGKISLAPSWATYSDVANAFRLFYFQATSEELDYIGATIGLENVPAYNDSDSLDGENFRDFIKYNGKYYILQPNRMTRHYFENNASTPATMEDIVGLTATMNFGSITAYTAYSRTNKVEYIYEVYNRNAVDITIVPDSQSIGATVASATQHGTYGNRVGELPEPSVVATWKFESWYWDADFKASFNPSSDIYPTANTNLYAKYIKTDYDYKVSFLNKSGEMSAVKQIDAYAGGTIAFPDDLYQIGESVEGYGTFQGWYWKDQDGKTLEYPWENEIQQNITIFGMWQNDGFSVTYENGGGTGGTLPTDSKKYDINTRAKVGDGAGFTKDGKVFAGWVNQANGAIYYPGMAMPISGDTTLFARYVDPDDLVNVTYHRNRSVSDSTVDNFDVQYLAPTTIKGDTNLAYTNPGYKFLGWSTTQDSLTPDSKFTVSIAARFKDEIHLFAVWQRQYTVSYNPGASGVNGVPSGETLSPGENHTVSSIIPTRNGYTFNGWAMTSGGIGNYSSGNTFAMPASNVELTANWTKIETPEPPVVTPVNRFTVTYHGNGFTSGLAPATVTYLQGSSATVNGFGTLARSGYKIIGWATSPDSKIALYTGGESILVNSNVNLYAVWEAVETDSIIDAVKEPDAPKPDVTKKEITFRAAVQDNGIPTLGFGDGGVPLYGPKGFSSWSLVDLILAAVGVVLAVYFVLKFALRRKNREDDEDVSYFRENGVEREEEKKARVSWLIGAILLAVISVVLFILTQDTSMPMVLLDWWTIVFAVILAAEFAVTRRVFPRQKKDEESAAVA